MVDSIAEVIKELGSLNPTVLEMARDRDSCARLLVDLPGRFTPQDVANEGGPQRTWELVGVFHKNSNRLREALLLFWRLYQHMLAAQEPGTWVHKGMPLVWMSDCFQALGWPVHGKRYLMLTLCEDALRGQGEIAPGSTGSYFRLVWGGLDDREFRRYARLFWELAGEDAAARTFPEALLQRVDYDWLTELPSQAEAFAYLANETYIRSLLNQLGASSGKALEVLADYLLSCMPGCRTRQRTRSRSTDYDVICSPVFRL